MQGDIQFCCISCDACQRRETPHRRPPLPTRRVPVDRPFQRVAIDLVEYTPYTVSQGCMYVLPVIDHLTRLVILAAIANKEVTTLARTLVDRVVSVFGVPELLHSDMGKEFENQLVQELQTVFDCKKTHTTPYRPQGK